MRERMKVMLLTQVLPYPPDSGPKVKTWNMLKCLVKRHEVTLVSFTRGDQAGSIEHLRKMCHQVYTVPITRSLPQDIWAFLHSVISGEPWLMLRDDRRAMHALVEKLTASQTYDLLHVDQLNMAQYANAVRGTRRVLDAHNALWTLYARVAKSTPNRGLRWLYAREAHLLREYEGRMCRRFDAVLVVSTHDKMALEEAVAEGPTGGGAPQFFVIPIAVDTAELQPRATNGSHDRILHMGTMFWQPNVDAVRWFAEKVMPLVLQKRPSAIFDVVGARPPARIRAYTSARSDVHVAGYVADPRSFIESAGVFVVPVQAGGGMRVKILTALAQGLPVVTTPMGCEGIEAESGRDLIVAETPEEFACATLRVLDQPQLQQDLGSNGRLLVQQHYDLPQLEAHIEQGYEMVTRGVR
jgi:polysaccharide biosynthesis protein PslH